METVKDAEETAQTTESDGDAKSAIAHHAAKGIGPDLALRVYTTRLLGGEPKLVLHGGGNTSVKTRMADITGEPVEVLCVKGSGWDMGTIEAPGLPAVRLAPLGSLLGLQALSDEDMVNVQRCNLLDSKAPNPSVETLLHAFLPHKFIDHTHANAVLSLTDQEDSDLFCVDVYGSRMGIVPYIMPGFSLAVRTAAICELKPKVEGLILQKHGIVTFGSSARESYERMIEMVSLAEDRLAKNRKAVFVPAPIPGPVARLAEISPILRGILSVKDERLEGAWRRPILDFRTGPAILNFVNGTELSRYAQAGVVTPDHVIRTKIWPLILAAPEQGRPVEFKRNTQKAVTTFTEYYKSYFARHNMRVGGDRKMIDPQPRVVLVSAASHGFGGSHLHGLARRRTQLDNSVEAGPQAGDQLLVVDHRRVGAPVGNRQPRARSDRPAARFHKRDDLRLPYRWFDRPLQRAALRRDERSDAGAERRLEHARVSSRRSAIRQTARRDSIFCSRLRRCS